MHERLDDQGLVVLAISYENSGLIKGFLDKRGYSMRAGSDPGRKVINAYGVRGFPSSALIGRDGNLLWKGSPYGAEIEIEKALGLPADAGKALSAYLESKEQRAIEHLIRKANGKFDLQAWAADLPAPELAADKKPSKLKSDKALQALQRGKVEAVHSLRAFGDKEFDLARWARDQYRKAFPLKKAELAAMLAKRRYRSALEALLARKTSGAVIKTAAKDELFARYCRDGFEDAGKMARKAIMAENWTFANRIPSDNDGFWREMSVSGMATSPDQKRVTGIILGGAMVMA
ncbi:MAG: peroxiredoxin family protein, partial [Planctomycetota bacterium]